MKSYDDLASTIDHTILRVDATRADIEKLGREALSYRFASVCIHPYWLPFLREKFPDLRLCTVIGFPLGLQNVKLEEARDAVAKGADELDIVVNHVQVMEGDWPAIGRELSAFRREFPQQTLKFIIESGRLNDTQIAALSRLAAETRFDFVKTSTGFAEKGATLDAVRLMKANVSGETKVKASGGIRDWPTAKAMIEAGADRIGTSSGLSIMKDAQTFRAAEDQSS